MIFHIGVREPSAEGVCRRRKRNTDDEEGKIENKKGKRSKSLQLADTSHKDATIEENGNYSRATEAGTSHLNLSYESETEEKQQPAEKHDSSGEVTGHSDKDNAEALREMLHRALPEENKFKQNPDSDVDSLSSISLEGYNSERFSSGHETDVDSDNFELFMPETFVDMVPFHANVILSSRRNSKATGIGQFTASSRGPSRTASKKSRRSIDSRRDSRSTTHGVYPDHHLDSRRSSKATTHGFHSDLHHDTRRGSRATTHGYQHDSRRRSSHGLHADMHRRPSNMFHQSPLATIEDNHTLQDSPRQTSKKTWINQSPTCPKRWDSSRNASIKKSPLAADTSAQSEDKYSPSCPKKWDPSRNASLKRSPLAASKSSPSCLKKCDPASNASIKTSPSPSPKFPPKVRLSLTPEHIMDDVYINSIEDDWDSEVEERTTFMSVLKNPKHYKLGFAYMFTRVAQGLTTAYMPLFLTDHLKYGMIAIAYFPLVILISGVMASFGGKKLNTILGNKWTFCLGSVMVMGASGWFFLLTEETRNVTYVPAFMSGCGTSIMFVTTLALAAEFVDADRKSGAFLMSSMGFFAKIATGVLFCLLQEFSPDPTGPDYVQYTHYVFALAPGVSALGGLVAFIIFIPATIQCKPIIATEDAETQTDETSFASTASVLDVIKEDVDTNAEATCSSYFNAIEEESDTESWEAFKNEIMGSEVIKEEEENVNGEQSEIIENKTEESEILGNEKLSNNELEEEEWDTAM